jgi:hypothetical protein
MEYRQRALRVLTAGLALMSNGLTQGQDPVTQQQLFQLQRQQEQQQIEQQQREAQQQQLQQQQLYQQQQQLQLQRQQDQLLQLQGLRQQPLQQTGAPLPLSESATQANIKTWDQLIAYVQYVSGISTLNGEIANEYAAAKATLGIPQEALTRLEQLRIDVLNESGIYRNNTGATAAALVISINSICNLIFDLVPAGSPDFPQSLLRASFDQSLMQGQFDLNTIKNTFASAAIADKANAGKDLLDSIIALQEFAARIATNAATDRAAASDEITQRLELMDQQMAAYENAVQQAETLSSARQEMESAVAAYLNLRADVLFTVPPINPPNGASGNRP